MPSLFLFRIVEEAIWNHSHGWGPRHYPPKNRPYQNRPYPNYPSGMARKQGLALVAVWNLMLQQFGLSWVLLAQSC